MENKTTENEESNALKQNDKLNPQIGRIYSVQRVDGQWIPADVLEKRELKGKPIEFFVHFENCKFFIQLNLNTKLINIICSG